MSVTFAPRAHGREGLVAGRVEEGQLPLPVLYLVRADVLGNAAGLGLDDGALADRVQQRRLPVVDVAHNRDDRRPRLEIRLVVLVDLGLELLVGGVLDRDLAADLGGDQLDLLVGQRLGRRLGRAEAHEDLDQLRHRLAERLGEVLDRHAGLDGHWARRLDDLARLLGTRLLAIAGLAAVLARASGTGVDHDTALAAACRSSLTGPDRAVWLVGTVSHRRQCRAVPARDRP